MATINVQWDSDAQLSNLSAQRFLSTAGEDETFAFTQTTGTPVDVTGYTMAMYFALYPGEGTILTLPDSRFSGKTSSGAFNVSRLAADTVSLPSRAYFWQVVRTDSGNSTVLSEGWNTINNAALGVTISVSPYAAQPLNSGLTAISALTTDSFGLGLLPLTTAASVCTYIGGTTVGQAIFTSTNPSAITFLRANANNTVSWLSASDFRTAIGAGTGSGDLTKSGSYVDAAILVADGTAGGVKASVALLGSDGSISTTGDLNLDGTAFVGAIDVNGLATINNSGEGQFVKVNGNTITGTGTLTLSTYTVTAAGNATISGTNTGDNATNSQYSSLVSNATHTGDATGATALTLATVNSNVGSFTFSSITVNAKGLVTAASSASLGTGVATALAINVGSAGAFVVNGGALGTPASGTLTNCTGYTVANLSGAGSGVLTWLATPTEANLKTAISAPTGSSLDYHLGKFFVTTDFTASGASAATLANVTTDGSTAVQWALAAGKKYMVTIRYGYTCVNTVGYQIQFTASGGLTATTFRAHIEDIVESVASAGPAATPVTALGSPMTSGVNAGGASVTDACCYAMINVNVAGTMTLQFASASNSNTARFKVGSVAICEYLA